MIVCPAVTVSPSLTATFQTVPCSGEAMETEEALLLISQSFHSSLGVLTRQLVTVLYSPRSEDAEHSFSRGGGDAVAGAGAHDGAVDGVVLGWSAGLGVLKH